MATEASAARRKPAETGDIARYELFEGAVQHANDPVAFYSDERSDRRGPKILYVNDRFAELTGWSGGDLIGQYADVLTGPGTDMEQLRLMRKELFAGKSVFFTLRKYRKDGSWFWAEYSICPLNATGAPFSIWVSIERDVTERRAAEDRMRLLTTALEHTSEMISIHEVGDDADEAFKIVYMNSAFKKCLGIKREDLASFAPLIGTRREEREMWSRHRSELLAGREATMQTVFHRKDGVDLWLDVLGQPIRNERGAVKHVLTICRDVTHRKRVDEQLTHAAHHDPLTDLYNRRYFLDVLDQAWTETSQQRSEHVLVFIDVDNLKKVNDGYGHAGGDEFLRCIAETLRTNFRENDVVARYAGDEFAVLMRGCTMADARAHLDIVHDAFAAARCTLEGVTLTPSISGGYTSLGLHAGGKDALGAADIACYQAKRMGRAKFLASGD